MQFTFSTQSQFDVPEGKYTAKFMGVKPLEHDPANPRLGNDGQPMGPAVAWEFEVQDEPLKGRRADRVTGMTPKPKTVCGRMLAAVTDQILKDGQVVDVAPFVGQLYRITVETKESGKGTRVSDAGLSRLYGSQQPAAPPPARPAPPAPPKPAAPPPAEGSKWEVYNLDGQWEPMTAALVRQFIAHNGFPPESVHVRLAGTEDARPADQFGFTADVIPW